MLFGDIVDFCRPPASKDAPDWKSPLTGIYAPTPGMKPFCCAGTATPFTVEYGVLFMPGVIHHPWLHQTLTFNITTLSAVVREHDTRLHLQSDE